MNSWRTLPCSHRYGSIVLRLPGLPADRRQRIGEEFSALFHACGCGWASAVFLIAVVLILLNAAGLGGSHQPWS